MTRVGVGRSLRMASILCALALVAGACGSSSKSSGGTQGGGGGSQPKGAPFKIGYIEDAVSLGSGSVNPYTIPAFDAWVKWTNANGGINGHPVELLTRREPNNPGVALTLVQQLLGQGVAVLLEDDANNSDAWLPAVQRAGVPIISTTSGTTGLAGSQIAFSTNTSLLFTPQYTVAAAAKIGGPKMSVFYCAEIPTCSQSVPAVAAVGKAIGVSVEFSTSILGSAPNYTAQCLSAKEHGAQSMWIADASTIILRVASSCAQQGYTPHQITSGEQFQQNFPTLPGMDGMVGTDGFVPFFDTSFPGVATMLAAFNRYDPTLTKDPQFGDLSTQQWTVGLLIGEAAKAGGVGSTNPLTAAAFLNGLYTLHSTNLGGMTPTLTFQRGQPNANRCWFWVEIQNGAYTLPDGLTPTCVPQ